MHRLLIIFLIVVGIAYAAAWYYNTDVAEADANSRCHERYGRADRKCTPGAINAAVTADNIADTICRRGWTATIRPPQQYTEDLKRSQMRDYGFSKRRLSEFEEDHLIPLEVGGSPTDPANLWPEPRDGAYGAADKDRDENEQRRLVCSGKKTLAEAQQFFVDHWTK